MLYRKPQNPRHGPKAKRPSAINTAMVSVMQAGQDAIRADIEGHKEGLKNKEHLQVSAD